MTAPESKALHNALRERHSASLQTFAYRAFATTEVRLTSRADRAHSRTTKSGTYISERRVDIEIPTARSTPSFQIHSELPSGRRPTLPHILRQSRSESLALLASPSAISGTVNSFLKVLFTFPSRYFFAIGFRFIFGFGGKLPSVWRSMSKERDSTVLHRAHDSTIPTGVSPSLLQLSSGNCDCGHASDRPAHYNSEWFMIIGLCYAHFTHRYYGDHIYLLFLRLLICLNSPGALTYPHAQFNRHAIPYIGAVRIALLSILVTQQSL